MDQFPTCCGQFGQSKECMLGQTLGPTLEANVRGKQNGQKYGAMSVWELKGQQLGANVEMILLGAK